MTPYYERAGIVIYHGDALDVLPSLSVVVDAIVTDPPFKLSQEYGPSVDADNLLAVSSIWGVAVATRALAHPGAVAAVFYDNRILPVGLRAMMQAGWTYSRMLTFYRRWGQASMFAGWMNTSDGILIFSNPGARPKYYGSAKHDVYVRTAPEPDGTGHPAQKPLDAVAHIVERITPPGGLVLDPYLGSGTTLVAAQIAGVRAIGIEAQERYCEIAARRLETVNIDPTVFMTQDQLFEVPA